jgi:hypothetical protein
MLKNLIQSGQFELAALYILIGFCMVYDREKKEGGSAPQPERQEARFLLSNPG